MAETDDPNMPLNPAFVLEINGNVLGPDVMSVIESMSFETADDLPTQMKIHVKNPDGVFTDSKMFQAGNEINVYMGYYEDLQFAGRVICMGPKHRFPEDDMPTFDLIAYDGSWRMMDGKQLKFLSPRTKDKDTRSAQKRVKRCWPENTAVQDMVRDIVDFGGYGWNKDLDEVKKKSGAPFTFNHTIIQRPNISDYDFIRGLANIVDAVFWVDGSEKGEWTLHFKESDVNGIVESLQPDKKQRTFPYGAGLLEFEPGYLIRDAKTRIIIEAEKGHTGELLTAHFQTDDDSPELTLTEQEQDIATKHEREGRRRKKTRKKPPDVTVEKTEALTTGGAIRIFLDDYCVETISNKVFNSQSELEAWGEIWFRKHSERFILGGGRLVGIPSIRAVQAHFLSNIGEIYSGEYYFSRVCHSFSAQGGYEIDFDARKIVGNSAKFRRNSFRVGKRTEVPTGPVATAVKAILDFTGKW